MKNNNYKINNNNMSSPLKFKDISFAEYTNQSTFKKRIEESDRILNLYIGRVPIVVEKIENSSIEDIDKHKFLVPSDFTIGQFMYVIRSRLKLTSEIDIFFYINNRMPPTSGLISQVYKEYKNDDGFLYIQYSGKILSAVKKN